MYLDVRVCCPKGYLLYTTRVGTGSGHLQPGLSRLEKNDLTGFSSSFLNVCIIHVYFSV